MTCGAVHQVEGGIRLVCEREAGHAEHGERHATLSCGVPVAQWGDAWTVAPPAGYSFIRPDGTKRAPRRSR